MCFFFFFLRSALLNITFTQPMFQIREPLTGVAYATHSTLVCVGLPIPSSAGAMQAGVAPFSKIEEKGLLNVISEITNYLSFKFLFSTELANRFLGSRK